jgi:hypothetical protein
MQYGRCLHINEIINSTLIFLAVNHLNKQRIFSLLFGLLMFLTISCNEHTAVLPDESSVVTPLKRPVGVSTGPIVSKIIGPAGGSLQSADGKITIDIPQGAFTTNTTVGIEPVTNTNIAGIGQAYRLTPHGEVFAKQLKITYSWASDADSVGLLQTLGLSYQAQDGVWRFVGADTYDSQTKTVSFKTTHFSDWALMNRISLSPYHSSLETGEKQTIKAMIFTEADMDNLFVPLVNDPDGPYFEPGYPVGTPVPLPSKFIGSWKMTGPGSLTKLNSNHVMEYRAPNAVNGTDEATVTLTLKAPVAGSFVLVSRISIMGDGWIELSINGANPVRFAASPVVKMGARYILSNPEDEGGGQFLLTWKGELGSHAYDLAADGTRFHFLPPGTGYNSCYIPGPDSPLVPSGGSVKVTKLSDGIAEGTFTVSNVGVGTFFRPEASASGRFRAKLFVK